MDIVPLNDGSASRKAVPPVAPATIRGVDLRVVSGFSGEEDEEAAVIPAPEATADNTVDNSNAPAEMIPPDTAGTKDGKEEDGEDKEDAADGEGDDVVEDDDDESEYEYEEDDDAAFSGFLVAGNATAAVASSTAESSTAPARIEDDSGTMQQKQAWREPSREAVNMSLRAERETTGGKRRLAQDLYRIMNQDTEKAGFSLAPASEDSMDKWRIWLKNFDPDSNLAKDMIVLGVDAIELEMQFPDDYPFEPPFCRVVRPRFKGQTGFVMNGALCMELLTKDGWNPINDIESVIVSIRSLLVVGDGRLQAACEKPESTYQALLKSRKRPRSDSHEQQKSDDDSRRKPKEYGGAYSMAEAKAAYTHLTDYHKRKGWDSSGWWARKG